MKNFDEIPDLLQEKGIELAESKSKYEYYDALTKTRLASIMIKLEGSVAQREMIARTSEEFTNHLELVRYWREKQLTKQAEYDSLEKSFDYQRSINANNRKF